MITQTLTTKFSFGDDAYIELELAAPDYAECLSDDYKLGLRGAYDRVLVLRKAYARNEVGFDAMDDLLKEVVEFAQFHRYTLVGKLDFNWHRSIVWFYVKQGFDTYERPDGSLVVMKKVASSF